MLIFLVSITGYYFPFFLKTGIISIVILTVISFYLLAWSIRIKRYWVVAVTVIALPILVMSLFAHLIADSSFDTVESPTGKEKLLIEHRKATLGETAHLYNFYRNTAFPGVIKKLNDDMVRIITHENGKVPDDLEVLGINNAEWVEGEGVNFHSNYAEIKVNFKH
ncbi:hypothetical protein [Lysinibacillus sp. RC79]|uniref:hypothetical protein n=1 Tax=Lysinibacillus sp. RC79 TaxID=3156296 RepID=UPI00351466AE